MRAFRHGYAREVRLAGLSLESSAFHRVFLREIAERPGITVGDLARLTGIPKSRVSVLMARLADQGIVRKEADTRDSRLVRLHVTAEGRRRAAEWSAVHQQIAFRLLRPLSDDELAVIADGLRSLITALGRQDAAPDTEETDAEETPGTEEALRC